MDKFEFDSFPEKGFGYHVILMTGVCNKPYVKYYENKESLKDLPCGTIIIAASANIPIYVRYR